MGFKQILSDVLKKVLVNILTIVIIIVGLFLVYKFFIAKLFF